MLTTKEIQFLREELQTAQRPLFFYDNDPDGLCSFLLIYKMHREGKSIMVKTAPRVDSRFLRKVEELQPDKIFVLDVPIVNQEFVNKVNRPFFWLDHHQPMRLNKVHYYNPRLKDPDIYIPTSRYAYQISGNEEDMWIAAIGCLGDYYLPDFLNKFVKKYPRLLKKKMEIGKILYKSNLGKLVRIFSFLLKGQSRDVYKCVKILTRIKSSDEILKQTSSQGKFLYKRFEQINQKYVRLIKEARKQVTRSKLLVFQYTEDEWSFTPDLANELSILYPKKVVIIARKKSGEMKCSLRAQFKISEALEKALEGIEGYGGGHPNACGAAIKVPDWDRFLQNFKWEL